ncbi:carbohydrate ABC transporter permease [Actinoplanes sp. CA-030573]|uniref:carbohydrate ABC transporter permease n=1 Tax=Actinoplanes sp. CA-030573 TaxID=3239898 RepID=UPI003D8E26E3
MTSRNGYAPAWLRPVVATFVTAIFFLPLYLVLVNVFKPGDKIIGQPAGLPFPATFDNIKQVLNRPDHLFWYGLVNSVEVTAVSIVVLTVLSAMCGYWLARSKGAAAKIMLVVMLAGLMIPPAVIIAPITEVLRSIGQMNSVVGLVLVNVGYYVPFGVFVFAGFVRTIPITIEEAAVIDGASRMRVFWQIVFPLLRPAAASVLIFLGVWIWNDFLNPLIILGPAAGTTVTVGIYRAVGEHQQDYGSVFALMFLATVPILAFYLIFQKYFVKGLTAGASKT